MTGQQDNFPNFPDFEEDGSKKYELIKDMLGWFNERKDITGPEFLERYSSRIPHKIYKYRSLNKHSFQEIVQQKAFFSTPENLNDPIDSRFVEYCLKTRTHCNDLDPALKFFFFCERKVSCFSTSYYNILMWAHYANKHQGFCIEYDYEDFLKKNSNTLQIYPILYTNNFQVIDVTNIEYSQDIIEVANLIKSKDWSYEDEWRLAVVKNQYGYLTEKKYAQIKISAIYFGCNFKDDLLNECQKLMKKRIIDFAIDNNIKVYDMEIETYPINCSRMVLRRQAHQRSYSPSALVKCTQE